MRDIIDLLKKLTEGEVLPLPHSPARTFQMGHLFNEVLSDPFARAYIEAIFFTEHEELDDKDVSQFSMEALEQIKQDCTKFVVDAGEDTIAAYGVHNAGHDFWLTRNHHGAGFWENDHCDEQTGERLTKLSDSFGQVDAYVGDDGFIYF